MVNKIALQKVSINSNLPYYQISNNMSRSNLKKYCQRTLVTLLALALALACTQQIFLLSR